MSMSEGSVIRIVRPHPGAAWEASTFLKLPYAPYAVSVGRDGTAFITLSDELVAIGRDRKIHTLLSDAPWGDLYPNNSILSPDERKLYMGMRQFVGEFDLRSSTLHLLVPSRRFINEVTE